MEAPAAVIRQCNRHHFSAPNEPGRDLPIGGRAVRWCVGELYAYWPGRGVLQEGSGQRAHGFDFVSFSPIDSISSMFARLGLQSGFCASVPL